MIDPRYHKELYSDVKGARYTGYEISATSIGAELAVDRLR